MTPQDLPEARCSVPPTRPTPTPSFLFSAWVPAATKSKGKSYCSKICCMYTRQSTQCSPVKNIPTPTFMFSTSTCVQPGKNFDEFYRRAVEEYGVHYIKGMVGKVAPHDGKLTVRLRPHRTNKSRSRPTWLCLPPPSSRHNPPRPLRHHADRQHGHQRLLHRSSSQAPSVESPTAGVFLSGVCQGPKDIPETVAQASAAAAQGYRPLSKDKLTCNPCCPFQRNDVQRLFTCANVCPYGAISYVDKEFRLGGGKTEIQTCRFG